MVLGPCGVRRFRGLSLPGRAVLHSADVATAAPIYLVSACTSGEEFVAAYRRYVDRTSLFVPIDAPIGVGLQGRFAITLADGGVMVEGVGEIISSARTPSVLHGRIGMTIRFSELDAASRTVLGELEQARLTVNPPAPSVAPRSATIPPQPRSTRPPIGGRIDAGNAPAICVAIGDVETLAKVEPKAPPKAGPKFVVPTIPPVSGRTASASTPPPTAAVGRPASASTPPPIPALRPTATTGSQPVVASGAPAPPSEPSSARPAAAPPERTRASPSGEVATVNEPVLELGRADFVGSYDGPPMPSIDEIELGRPGRTDPPPMAGDEPTSPFDPATAKQLALADATSGPKLEIDEPTDLTLAPLAPTDDHPERTTMVGVAVGPTDATVLPAATAPDTDIMPAAPANEPATQPGHPVVEEATPSGDWTITPGEDRPTIAPRKRERDPSGDWTISLTGEHPLVSPKPVEAAADPAPAAPRRPTGRNLQRPPAANGAPGRALVRKKGDARPAPAQAPVIVDEPKVQIDPTLIEPAIIVDQPPPPDHPQQRWTPAPFGPTSPNHTGPMPVGYSAPVERVTPPLDGYPRLVTDGGVGFFRDSGEIARDSTSLIHAPRRNRAIVIAISAAIAVIGGIVAVWVVTRGDDGGDDSPPTNPTNNPIVIATPDAAAIAPPPAIDAAVEQAVPSNPPVDAGTALASCSIDVVTSPAAEIVIDRNVVGTAPQRIELPCGSEVKVTLRKNRYLSVTKSITPTEAGAKLRATLTRQMFAVKVSSQPAGAAVSVNGKAQGVTPTTIKVPAFETSTITLTKDGYAPFSQRLAAKQNNQALQAQLTRRR